MNRRGFLGSLAGAAAVIPLAESKAATTFASSPLPVGSDLSLTALELTLRVAKEKGFGKPLCLMIGPENLFVAREIFGRGVELIYTPDPNDPQINKAIEQDVFGYRVVSALPMNFWMVQFERGTITSQGPN